MKIQLLYKVNNARKIKHKDIIIQYSNVRNICPIKQ
jgi:hypothetical protein